MTALLHVRQLEVKVPIQSWRIHAVHDLSFQVHQDETVALVGESGCGKSVTALSIMGLLDQGAAAYGQIMFNEHDLLDARPEEMRKIRGEHIAMIFQDAATSLDPVYTVGEQIAETLRFHRHLRRRDAQRRSIELLSEVGIPDPTARAKAYPHELSGGQRQRVVVAIALACSPTLLIADEPTTALDVTVEAQILELIRSLQSRYGMALLLITHDIGVVAEMANRVLVMYAGKLVEEGTVDEILSEPQHPYTEGLLRSIPRPTLRRTEALPSIPGSVPDLVSMPAGCRFEPRCPYAWTDCRTEEPPLFNLGDGRLSRCWLQASSRIQSSERLKRAASHPGDLGSEATQQNGGVNGNGVHKRHS